jgi:hypothetical protein
MVEIADQFRRIAGELEKAPTIDEQGGSIKIRLLELLNKRAKDFDQATTDAMMAAAISVDRQAFDALFSDYSNWEDSAIEEFKTFIER